MMMMDYRNEWDTLADWLQGFIQHPPLPVGRHIAFVAALVFSVLSVRIIIQHRCLQRWVMIGCMGKGRTRLERARRRVMAELAWNVLSWCFIAWTAYQCIWEDADWWAYPHHTDRSTIFGSHILLYMWYCLVEAVVVVDLLWLLQYRRFYREQDSIPGVHAAWCITCASVIVFLAACEWTGHIKVGTTVLFFVILPLWLVFRSLFVF